MFLLQYLRFVDIISQNRVQKSVLILRNIARAKNIGLCNWSKELFSATRKTSQVCFSVKTWQHRNNWVCLNPQKKFFKMFGTTCLPSSLKTVIKWRRNRGGERNIYSQIRFRFLSLQLSKSGVSNISPWGQNWPGNDATLAHWTALGNMKNCINFWSFCCIFIIFTACPADK